MDMGVRQESERADIEWTINVRGSRHFLQRILLTVAEFGQALWWLVFVAIPIFFLILTTIAENMFVYLYTMYSAVGIMILSQASERFINMTVEVNGEDGKFSVTYHVDDYSISRSERKETVLLENIKSATIYSFRQNNMIQLHHKKPLSTGTVFLAQPETISEVYSSLERHSIPIQNEGTGQLPNWLWGRIAAIVLLIVVIPISILLMWPIYYSWAIILVLMLHLVLLLRQE